MLKQKNMRHREALDLLDQILESTHPSEIEKIKNRVDSKKIEGPSIEEYFKLQNEQLNGLLHSTGCDKGVCIDPSGAIKEFYAVRHKPGKYIPPPLTEGSEQVKMGLQNEVLFFLYNCKCKEQNQQLLVLNPSECHDLGSMSQTALKKVTWKFS